jgi:hypothetical protein
MRFALALVLGIAVVTLAGSTYTASGEEKKDKAEAKKFEGTLSCTKCSLNETKGCGHALIVKVDGKEVKYYLKDKGGKEAYHKDCCQADVKAVVTGVPGEEDGKKIIKEPKVEIKK